MPRNFKTKVNHAEKTVVLLITNVKIKNSGIYICKYNKQADSTLLTVFGTYLPTSDCIL